MANFHQNTTNTIVIMNQHKNAAKALFIKIFLVGIFFPSISGLVYSQSVHQLPPKTSVSVQGGYAYITERGKGLTNRQNNQAVRSGLSWDVLFTHRALPNNETNMYLGVGLLYSGYNSGKAELPDSSDNLFMHYLAPQLLIYYFPSNKVLLKGYAGIGCDWYINQSEVYTKSRYVTGRTLALNAGIEVSYFLSSQIAVSANVSYIDSHLEKFDSHYGGEKIQVKFNDAINNSRLLFTGGLSFYF